MSENKKTETMPVVVHKANVPLMKGESIHKFTRELSDKGREHCFKKLNMVKGKGDAYMVEAFGDAAIFGVYKSSDPMSYHVFKYTRDDKTGAFEFGDLTEVEKVVGYRPKTMGVSKAKKVIPGAGTKDPSKVCPSCGKKYLGSPSKCPHCDASLVSAAAPKDEAKTKKAFWTDVI